ncbi:MAG: hypothetical protein DIZ78_12910 [endosymbiont of Escarpia spicata]|uniref:Uncharacterized protein n=1 Tax=endosymbiont of Escarpia spicata TaxID=2200908 RepID=A0A370DIA0_9GAMM|nr:MAG: hypothetical protein DIZ78_12910 [endosymbiont of Escarpia spicata]
MMKVKNNSNIILLILLLLFSSGLFAKEIKGSSVIQGAFGMKLGEMYLGQETTQKDIIQWKFPPSIKSPYFEKYYFWTSPLSKRVIGISAISDPIKGGTGIGEYDCQRRAEEIVSILRTKYGELWERNFSPTPILFGRDSSSHYSFYKRYQKDNAYIELACLVDVSELSVTYSTADFREEHANNKCELIGNMFYKDYTVEYIDNNYKRKTDNLIFYNNFVSIYSHRYLSERNKNNFFYSKWVHIYDGKEYLPVPKNMLEWAKGMSKCRTDDIPRVHLSIRYGSSEIENLSIKELDSIQKGKALNNPKAKGL